MDVKKPFQILHSVGMSSYTIILMMGLKYIKGKIFRKKDRWTDVLVKE
jgi:hypothetical protein